MKALLERMKIKIKHVEVEASKSYTFLRVWLFLPDAYTFLKNLGSTDREYLDLQWNLRHYGNIIEFLKFSEMSRCIGSIRIGSRKRMANKKFSWTRFRGGIYGVWTELNTPIPLNTKPFPISRVNNFLHLLRIPTHTPSSELKDFITLYILRRDYDRN